jgi:ubiquinone/menaquinone biosynthesis C-methylase UbiE
VSGLLEIVPNDCVLEIGFGPGVAIGHLSRQTRVARIVGIDASREMVEQARARNIDAIRSGRVDLRLGTVEHMPFGSNGFDKALAINSMQVWPDAVIGLREVLRVLKPGQRWPSALRPIPVKQRKARAKAFLPRGSSSPAS